MKKTKNPIKQNVKQVEYTVRFNEKDYEFKINEPTFDELALAMSKLVNVDQTIDLAHSGKMLWDTCVVEYDSEIEDNPQLLLTVAIKLASDYLQGLEAEIKKKG